MHACSGIYAGPCWHPLGLSLTLLALGWGSHSLLTLLHGSTPPAWLQLVVFGLLALLATCWGVAAQGLGAR